MRFFSFVGIILSILAIYPSVLLADEEGMLKYRNYTPEQFKSISEKELYSSVPMSYSEAAQKGLSKGAELLFGMQLNTLMYSGVSNYQEAIKKFQYDLGDKPTGILTVWQIYNLEKRSDMQKLNYIGFPDDFLNNKNDDIASVQGTMMIHDEKSAWPINHVKFLCYKNDKYCEYSQLILDIPRGNNWSQNYVIIEMEHEFYTITNWDENTIDAISSTNKTDCRVITFSLNFKTKEFYQIARNGDKQCEALMGEKLPFLAKPRISQIVDGQEIINEEFKKIKQASYDVLSSDFKRKVESLVKSNDEEKNK